MTQKFALYYTLKWFQENPLREKFQAILGTNLTDEHSKEGTVRYLLLLLLTKKNHICDNGINTRLTPVLINK